MRKILTGEITLYNDGKRYRLHYQKGFVYVENDDLQVELTGFDEMEVFYALATIIVNAINKHGGGKL